MNDKITFFKSKSEEFFSRYQNLNKELKLLSFLRVITFVVCLVIIVISANNGNLPAIIITSLVFILFFGYLIKRFNTIQYQVSHHNFLHNINEDEILRLEGSLDSFDPGFEYLNDDHPYISDLDVFGKNSLYQLVNRCSTFWGKKTLANWLSNKAEKEEISLRQESIKELSKDIDWLQQFQATGRHYKDHTDIDPFLKWLKSDDIISNDLFYQIIRFISPIISITIIALTIFSAISFIWIFVGIVVNGLIVLTALKKVKSIHDNTSIAIKSLKGLEALIILVENVSFKSIKANKIKAIYAGKSQKVSARIGYLNRILQNLDNRNNQFYQFLNLFFLFDLHYSISAERWKTKQPENIQSWFDAIGEMEGLISFAGIAFSNPNYAFPKILEDEHSIDSRKMGHPLIPHTVRVSNDFFLSGKGNIAIITGSNMAGKSTFLRTIGVNMVMAFAGSPVCADVLSLSHTQIFSSMRTQDNLEENISSFYAELKRIHHLLNTTSENTPVFFLLDEILKGTNSHDRHLGAVSLVHQLAGKNTSGLISTHDINLAKETTKGRMVTNYSFNSIIRGDEILFDYKLTPGICESFNASKLMKKMGIEIIE